MNQGTGGWSKRGTLAVRVAAAAVTCGRRPTNGPGPHDRRRPSGPGRVPSCGQDRNEEWRRIPRFLLSPWLLICLVFETSGGDYPSGEWIGWVMITSLNVLTKPYSFSWSGSIGRAGRRASSAPKKLSSSVLLSTLAYSSTR